MFDLRYFFRGKSVDPAVRDYSWDDVSLGQFERIQERISGPSSADGDMDVYRMVGMMSIVTGVEEDVYYGMPVSELMPLIGRMRFLGAEPEPQFRVGRYVMNGRLYDLTESAMHMGAGQYIDFMEMMRSGSDGKLDIAGCLSAVLVPAGCKYNEGYDVRAVRDDILRYLPVRDALGIVFFFARELRGLTGIMQDCIRLNLKKEMKALRRRMKNGKEQNAMLKERLAVLERAGAGLSL